MITVTKREVHLTDNSALNTMLLGIFIVTIIAINSHFCLVVANYNVPLAWRTGRY